MKILLITFSSTDAEREVEIVTRIKGISGKWARLTPNSWCVKTERNTADVRDTISRNMVNNEDRIFVVEMTDSAWASYCLPKEVTDWIKE